MTVQYLERDAQPKLAYVYSSPASGGEHLPHVMFFGGYRSDMDGTKALYLEAQCRARGQGFLRFDYAGHGRSGGVFDEGTIGLWLEDALDVLDYVIGDSAPVVFVGSSMGGWIALLASLRRISQMRGVIGIAAAPDFTEEIFHERLNAQQQEALMEKGVVYVPNDYSDEPYVYTRNFYEDGKAHLLLTAHRTVDFPICLIQGRADKDVQWETAVRIQNAFGLSEEHVIFVEDGDHRLSRPQDLVVIDQAVCRVSGIP